MKTLKYINLVLLLGLLSSCEEIIDIDLESADPALIVDGQILINKAASITLSYSTDYYDSEEPTYEDNAIVTITDVEGNSEELQYESNGVYTGESLLGEVGEEYTLSIVIDGMLYEAKSSLLTPTDIISLTPKESNRGRGEEKYYELEIAITNNPLEENYYLVKYFYEDEDGDQKSHATLSWEFFAKEEVIEYSGMMMFEEGTVVDVEVYSIDEGTYDYYSELNDIDGEGMGGSSTPFNPASNFGEGVLGYFRAWSTVKGQVTMRVEE